MTPFRYRWQAYLAAIDPPLTMSNRMFLAWLGALADEAGFVRQPHKQLLSVIGGSPDMLKRWIAEGVRAGLIERVVTGGRNRVATYRLRMAHTTQGGLSVPPNDSQGGLSVPPNDSQGGLSVPPNDSQGGLSVPPNDSQGGLSVPPSSDLSLKKSVTSTGDEKNEVSDETIDLQAAGWISAVNAQLDPRHRMRATRTLLAAAGKCHDSSPTLFLDRVRAMHNLQALRGAGPIAQSLLDWADDWVANRPAPPPPPCEHGVEAGVFCEPCLCEHGSLPARCPACRRAGVVVLT